MQPATGPRKQRHLIQGLTAEAVKGRDGSSQVAAGQPALMRATVVTIRLDAAHRP
jgi:hypothetical protein